jgi:hypothetical protein
MRKVIYTHWVSLDDCIEVEGPNKEPDRVNGDRWWENRYVVARDRLLPQDERQVDDHA